MDIKATKSALRTAAVVEVPFTGQDLLEEPLFNKGTAFTVEERHELGLLGLLPPDVETIEQQVARCYEAFVREPSGLEKHIFLRNLQDENETLFYRLILEHIEEMLPIIYTPVVGEACQKFSHIYRRPRGLFISYPQRADMDEILGNCALNDVEVIVVTDAERILGLGDQGAGGMGIPIGKLSLYTAIGGIHPATTLPIMLDVGTNNHERLNDPSYIGWRSARVTGEEYDQFVEQFVSAIERNFPHVLLQFEDFASRNAVRILERYRDRLCTFNDDIQGTAAVATGTLLAAIGVTGLTLRDQRVVVLGAGSAGTGISNQLIAAMIQEGLSEEEARSRFYMIDRKGLIHEGRGDLSPTKQQFQQATANIQDWGIPSGSDISFAETVRNVQPTILIGATGQAGAITEEVVKEMAAHVDRPIIFPLSNPTSHCEAIPADLLEWTKGQALVATGSPFAPVEYGGRTIPIAQCNNSYIFPAVGLGVRAANASRVTDSMFMAAAAALKEHSPALHDPDASLLPALTDVRAVAQKIALAVAMQAQQEGVARPATTEQMQQRIEEISWSPAYLPMKRQAM